MCITTTVKLDNSMRADKIMNITQRDHHKPVKKLSFLGCAGEACDAQHLTTVFTPHFASLHYLDLIYFCSAVRSKAAVV